MKTISITTKQPLTLTMAKAEGDEVRFTYERGGGGEGDCRLTRPSAGQPKKVVHKHEGEHERITVEWK